MCNRFKEISACCYGTSRGSESGGQGTVTRMSRWYQTETVSHLRHSNSITINGEQQAKHSMCKALAKEIRGN